VCGGCRTEACDRRRNVHSPDGARGRAATRSSQFDGGRGQRLLGGPPDPGMISHLVSPEPDSGAIAYQSLRWMVSGLPEYYFPHAADSIANNRNAFQRNPCYPTGVFFGLFPALQRARPEISQVMQSNTRKIDGTVRGKILRGLIAGQIA